MEFEKLTNKEIVEVMKYLEVKHETIKKNILTGHDLLDLIKIEFDKAETILKKRLNIK